MVFDPLAYIVSDLTLKVCFRIEQPNESSLEVTFATCHPEAISNLSCKEHDFLHALNELFKARHAARFLFDLSASLSDFL